MVIEREIVIAGVSYRTGLPILERIKSTFKRNNCPFKFYGCKGSLIQYQNELSLRGGITVGPPKGMDGEELFQFSCSYCCYNCIAASLEHASNTKNIGPNKRIWLEKLAKDSSMQAKFRHVKLTRKL